MRYSILGFNQELVLQYDLDVRDLLLLDYIYNAVASPTMEHIIDDNINYVWLQHKKVLKDLPILNISIDRFKKLLKKLVDLKLLKTKQINNGIGRGSKSFYTITILCEELRFSSVKNNTSSDDHVLKITPEKEQSRVKNNTPYNILNNINKQLKEDNKERDIDWFVGHYNNICCSLPKVKSVTEKRKKAILNILKKYSDDDILDVFELVENSDFCKGNNDRGWKADIDFILREDKFVNILEGKYNNSKSKSNNKRFVNEGHTERYTEAEKEEMQEVLEELRKNGKKTEY